MPLISVSKVSSSLFAGMLLMGASTPVHAAARTQLQQDVEGYAVATCLTQQDSSYLKEQGDGWGSIVINRGRGDVEDWQPLIDAVKSAVKKQPVAVIAGDGPQKAVPMPVFFCAEIIDRAEVRKAIDQTMKKMKPAYRKR